MTWNLLIILFLLEYKKIWILKKWVNINFFIFNANYNYYKMIFSRVIKFVLKNNT